MLVTEHPERIGRLVLTNCDCFEKFPPQPFKAMFKAAQLPGGAAALARSLRIERDRTRPARLRLADRGAHGRRLLHSFVDPFQREASAVTE